MKKLIPFLLLVALISLFLLSCKNETNEEEWIAQHVVLIGLDGWTARSLEKAEMPIIKDILHNGSYTLKKRSALPSSSAINWATMFMGSGPELHGFTEWGSKTPEVEPREVTHYGLYPSIWGLVRDNYPEAEIGYFYQWDGFQYFAELKAMNTQRHVTVEEGSPLKVDEQVALQASSYIKEKKPNFVGVFIDEPDHTGHTFGFDSPEYYEKLKDLDAYVGTLVEAVKEAGIYEETIFIITSDHGGIEKGHGGKTMEEMETAFIIAGKNIRQGYHFTQSMMQYDIAPTIAHIFRIKTPQVWIGRAVKELFITNEAN